MKRWVIRISIYVLLVLLAGCVAGATPEPRATDVVFVAVKKADLKLPDCGGFAWAPMRTVLSAGQTLPETSAQAMLEDALGQALSRRCFTPATAPGDLQVGYLLVLDDQLDDAALASRFGIDAGLVRDHSKRKGTLIIDLVNPADGKTAWRGVIQSHLHEQVDDATRRARLSKAVETMLQAAPLF